MKKPLVSIITVVFNNKQYIESAIKSVLGQTYKSIEYIVVDGGSTDGTVEIINKYKSRISKFISGPDRGIFDALNKGIRLTTGNVVGHLHSDDFYATNGVLEKIVRSMEEEKAEACWGDLVYVDRNNESRIVRFWKSSEYRQGKFRNGWMPPHTTFYAQKSIYEKYGIYNLNFGMSADYELMLRFLEKYRVKSCYIPETLVKMRVGGVSNRSIKNIKYIIKSNIDSYRAWRANGLRINPLRILLKPLSKIFQSIHKSN